MVGGTTPPFHPSDCLTSTLHHPWDLLAERAVLLFATLSCVPNNTTCISPRSGSPSIAPDCPPRASIVAADRLPWLLPLLHDQDDTAASQNADPHDGPGRHLNEVAPRRRHSDIDIGSCATAASASSPSSHLRSPRAIWEPPRPRRRASHVLQRSLAPSRALLPARRRRCAIRHGGQGRAPPDRHNHRLG